MPEVAEQPEVATEPVSISASQFEQMMAEIQQPKAEETQSAPAAQPETVDTTKAEPTPTETTEPAKAETVAEAKPEPADWKEALKGKSVKEILVALNIDEKIGGIIDHYKEKGDIKEWVEAYSKDFDKMDAKELLRLKVKSDYAGTEDAEELELLYEDALNQYKLDADLYDEKEIRLANIKLQNDVRGFREKLKQEQSERLVPKFDPTAEATQQQQQQMQAYEQERKQYADLIAANDAAKLLIASKQFTIGQGEDAYKMPIADPQANIDLLLNPEKYNALVQDKDGKPDVAKQLLIAAISADPYKALQDAVNHGKKLGTKSLATELENPSQPRPVGASTEELDVYQAMAKYGKIIK